MPEQLLPVAIMFLITVLFSAGLMLPVQLFKKAGALFRFYWKGFWALLSTIAAVAGSQATLGLLGYNVEQVGSALLDALVLVLVLFVAFAWLRLFATGAFYAARKVFTRPSSGD